MIYTDKTKRAIKLCYEAHAGQEDKSGLPYVHHPLHLAEQMDDELSTTAIPQGLTTSRQKQTSKDWRNTVKLQNTRSVMSCLSAEGR